MRGDPWSDEASALFDAYVGAKKAAGSWWAMTAHDPERLRQMTMLKELCALTGEAAQDIDGDANFALFLEEGQQRD